MPEPKAPTAKLIAGKRSTVSATSHIIEAYSAYIGEDDLFNSKGVRLTQPWQVLRQDRANVHRFGISQNGDSTDSFFGSSRNRAIMERMVQKGSISSSARRRLLDGGASVSVNIYGTGSRGDYINVVVH
jgi:hypothetical protein